MIFYLWLACFPALWLTCLLRESPGWVRALNKLGAAIGRAVAWWMTGQPGIWIGQRAIDQERRAEAMARLMLEAAGWRRDRWTRTCWRPSSTGLAQYVASPQRGGLPGEVWRPGYGWQSRRPAPHQHGPAWYCYSYGCDQHRRGDLL